ncbi:Electron transfer flavoprotein subunit beta [compost metagenome]
MPHATIIMDVKVEGDALRVKRELEGGWFQWVAMPVPAVLTIQSGINQLRYATLKGIMAAKKKPLEEKPAQVSDSRLVVEALELPPTRPTGKIVGQGVAAVPELVRLLREEAKVL